VRSPLPKALNPVLGLVLPWFGMVVFTAFLPPRKKGKERKKIHMMKYVWNVSE